MTKAMGANPPLSAALKLRAEDQDDIVVFSAILQDAVSLAGDMVYLPEDRRFAIVVDRLRRETLPKRKFERIRCGICFEHVVAVQRQGFHPRNLDRLMVLLALRAGGGSLQLDFAGGLGVRLEVDAILCHLEDLSEPWRTRSHPRHPIEGNAD